MRRILAAALLGGTLTVAPAHASQVTTILIAFDLTVGCDQATHVCTADFAWRGCLETFGGPACTIDPLSVELRGIPAPQPAPIPNTCPVAWNPAITFPFPEPLVVHTESAGEVVVGIREMVVTPDLAVIGGDGVGAVLTGAAVDIALEDLDPLTRALDCPSIGWGIGEAELVVFAL
jgi:hypothetical protein